ncbi:MAG: 50S ribosomal protein L11 methyltransferase [Syntrophaceae bacterium]|jgi:ribosomal protein L11 methyltransferase|nr:50S ribosomal protein L11 methyltransferase [Syntrophaceae bacterium]HOC60639.1 50S ribosomal protein L11 methyltransferase [Smithellaceae bacterium]HQM45236.1 50S ribosomal protein L11 methyltransferase [Smithellaceae bacterium]
MTVKEHEKWLKISIKASAETMDALSNFLEENGAQGVFSESLLPPGVDDFPEPADIEVINAFFPTDIRSEKRLIAIRKYLKNLEEIFPDAKAPELYSETITDPDWGEQWKKYFKPIRVCKNIVIKPTWERYTPESRDIVVDIDPGMAFGTGQHASTRMCMQAIEDIILKDRSVTKWKVLDVGCGTGILGITAAKMGAKDVICVDNDPKATEIAAENAVINGVADQLRIRNEDAVQIHEERNLIIANLTSKLLVKLHPQLVKLLISGGYLIISGIIEQDISTIEKHFLHEPLVLHHILTEKEWICYILKKNRADGKA